MMIQAICLSLRRAQSRPTSSAEGVLHSRRSRHSPADVPYTRIREVGELAMSMDGVLRLYFYSPPLSPAARSTSSPGSKASKIPLGSAGACSSNNTSGSRPVPPSGVEEKAPCESATPPSAQYSSRPSSVSSVSSGAEPWDGAAREPAGRQGCHGDRRRPRYWLCNRTATC